MHVQCIGEQIVQHGPLAEEAETDESFDEYSREEHNSPYEEEFLMDDDAETGASFEEEMVELCCVFITPNR